jgi:phosphoglycolate phosphatase-like HAD superfamily hydrolase
MIVLFWDIDGTLLTTGKGGVPAWEHAVRDVTGREFELASIRIPGLTDYQIAVRTFDLLGIDADMPMIHQMVARYESLLPEYLPQRQGHVMPNVRQILDATCDRPDIRSYLLTGNTRGGAKAKLTHYELFRYFADGAFAEDPAARATIALRALELARQAGPIAEESIFVIGDTPHDIECANAIGAKTIAVSTGGYSFEELEAHQPWQVMAQLPVAEEFLQLIGAEGPPEGRRHAAGPADAGRHDAGPADARRHASQTRG